MRCSALHPLVCALITLAGTSPAQTNHIYVRGDGRGSDSAGGTSWAVAYASLSQALSACVKTSSWGTRPYGTDHVVNVVYVQASAEGQAYASASWTYGYANPGPHFEVQFQGGGRTWTGHPLRTEPRA